MAETLQAIGVASAFVLGFISLLWTILADRNRHELNKELEKIKTRLQVQYSRLYNDRADAMREIYSLLFKIKTILDSIEGYQVAKVLGVSPPDEWLKAQTEKNITNVLDNYNSFTEYYSKCRILFSARICGLVDDLLQKIVILVADPVVHGEIKDERHAKNMGEIRKSVTDSMSVLEAEFRDLLSKIEIE